VLEQLATVTGKIGAVTGVTTGAVTGFLSGPNDAGTVSSLADAITGAVTGGTVVLIAALVVRWVNVIADRRDASAGVTVTEYRELAETHAAALAAERIECQRLTAENTALRARLDRGGPR